MYKTTAPLPVHDFSPDAKKNIYAKLFKLHRGGKHVKPRELTQVSDWGEQAQLTKMRLEK